MDSTLELIADEIIGHSDGNFHIGYTEEYEKLSPQDKEAVMNVVWSEIESCAVCGWYWHRVNLEYIEGEGDCCWHCVRDYEAEEIDEE